MPNDAAASVTENSDPGGGTQMRISGTVKRFDAQRGFGFITRDDGGRDCFVHFSAIQGGGFRSLEVGERVEFDVADSPKGPQAENVVRLAADGQPRTDSAGSGSATHVAHARPRHAPVPPSDFTPPPDRGDEHRRRRRTGGDRGGRGSRPWDEDDGQGRHRKGGRDGDDWG